MKQIDLYKFVTKNEPYRPALTGVFHDEEAQTAVATDSQILVASTNHYDPEKAGQIIGPDGLPVLCKNDKGVKFAPKFPKWKSVIPDMRAGRPFPLDELIKAYQNAANFMKNVPATYEDGTKIRKDQRTVYLAVGVQDRGGMYGDYYYIGFTFILIKRLMTLPQEGAKVYAYGPRRALLWVNESEGIRAIFMPTIIDQKAAEKAGVDGLYNPEEEGKATGMYMGPTTITCDRYGCAGRLFRTPEKAERVPTYKCLGEDNNRPAVHLYPVSEFEKVEGTESFYTRPDPDGMPNPQLYKQDSESGFLIYCGYAPTDREKLMPVLEPVDKMTYAQMVVEKGWNREPSRRVEYFFKRIGQPVPAY